MDQGSQPEKESQENQMEREEGTQEDFGVGEQGKNKEETKKPTIPDTQKPEIPQEENIPSGGPGGQGQTQQTTQPQTQEDKTKKIKEELKKPIQINTPQERKESSEIEDKHNQDVLSQN